MFTPAQAEQWLPVIKDAVETIVLPFLLYIGARHGQQNREIKSLVNGQNAVLQEKLSSANSQLLAQASAPVVPTVVVAPIAPLVPAPPGGQPQ